jgi:hypothetical protein
MAHYNKFNKIEMEILKDGEVIGYNYYFFKKDKNETIVTNQIKFTVKLFGATVFEIEGYGEEKYIKDKLISFNSKTLQNKKEKFVNLKLIEEKNNKFEIKDLPTQEKHQQITWLEIGGAIKYFSLIVK